MSDVRYTSIPAAQRYAAVRTQIEEAAQEAFVRYGYAATTIESIAVVAGVSPRTVYRHFGSKGALVGRSAEGLMRELLDLTAPRAAAAGVVQALQDAVSSMGLDHLPRAFLQEMTDDREARGSWLYEIYAHQDELARIIADSAPGGIDPIEARVRAGGLIAAIDTGFRDWLTGDPTPTAVPSLLSALAAATRLNHPHAPQRQGEAHEQQD
jgi:AcrR family transcriptional regulator